ncbi:MAG: protein kinase [Myxococcales bacterium]|nr:protein kinase [Myxococcales bacterium]
MGELEEAKVGARFGAYRLVRELGKGATATVFEAVHEELSRHVAIKVLNRELLDNEAARARFTREGKAAARVHHPHVVEVFDVGVTPQPYLVMELVAGGTLEGHLVGRGALGVDAACELFLPVVSALQHIHAAGIVHRDLKPSNVLLRRDLRGRLHPKVADFGISKVNGPGEALTREHTVLGTVGYMAPEQLRSAATVDGATDRWAVGVMLLEAVSGEPAFTGETTAQLIRAVLEDEPAALSSVQAPLREILARLLAKSPSERFGSDTELGLALSAITDAGADWAESFREIVVTAPGATLDETTTTEVRPARRRYWIVPAMVIGAGLLVGARITRRTDKKSVGTPTPSVTVVVASQSVAPPSSQSSVAPQPDPIAAPVVPASSQTKPILAVKTSAPPPPVTVSAKASASTPPPPPPPASTVPTGSFGAPILE